MKTTIKIQEFAMPRITTADLRGFRRGYNAFLVRHGIAPDHMRHEITCEAESAKQEKPTRKVKK